MKNFKKIAITLLVLFMLVPSFVFANSVEETPELKAKIENIVKTMPEDKAIDAIEELFGENNNFYVSNSFLRSVNNFAIYKLDSENISKSEKAFNENSYIEVEDGFVNIYLETQYMSYLGKKADVTKVTVLGKHGAKNEGVIGNTKPAIQGTGKQVPVDITIKVPVSEIEKGIGKYNSTLKVQFETNLRDSFNILGGVFPDAMINPKARLAFNK